MNTSQGYLRGLFFAEPVFPARTGKILGLTECLTSARSCKTGTSSNHRRKACLGNWTNSCGPRFSISIDIIALMSYVRHTELDN